MNTEAPLPETLRDLFNFSLPDRLAFGICTRFFELIQWWKYPARAYGDLERMTFLDKVYWIYKTTNPIRYAHKNSGLETYFAEQAKYNCVLPHNFSIANELHISAVGDLINHRYLKDSGSTLYSEVADLIFGADLAMANLECPIYPRGKKAFVFDFNEPPPLYYDQANFDVVKGFFGRKYDFFATACNHSLDFGMAGLESTADILNRERIAYHGININFEQSQKATILEKCGFKIGVVSYTFGLNNYRPPNDRTYAVNRLSLNDGVDANDFQLLQRQIAYCRERNSDFIIAQLHWGMEHEFYPLPEQLELAHHIVELGVDAIFGHHPHVIQPMEIYRTQRDPQRNAPIYYSLGNLVNYFSAPYLCRSGVARLHLVKGFNGQGQMQVYVKDAQQVEVLQTVDAAEKKLRLVPASTKFSIRGA